MNYSMNYYSKKNLENKDIYHQDPEVLESVTNREKKRTTAGNTKKETSPFQFVVPWQLP